MTRASKKKDIEGCEDAVENLFAYSALDELGKMFNSQNIRNFASFLCLSAEKSWHSGLSAALMRRVLSGFFHCKYYIPLPSCLNQENPISGTAGLSRAMEGMCGELSNFLKEHKLTAIGSALSACGITTLKEVRTYLSSPKTSYKFCADLLNKGVHNSDLKLLKCSCRRRESDDIEVVAKTWNFCILLPFDMVVPSKLQELARNPFAHDDEALEFAMVKMCFA